MNLLFIKVIFSILILLTTLFGNIGPLYIYTPIWLFRLGSLACGVFIGAGLIHLLTDSCDEINNSNFTKFPISHSICVVVFVLLSYLEMLTVSEHDIQINSSDGSINNENVSDFVDEKNNNNEMSIRKKQFSKENKGLSATSIPLYIVMVFHSIFEGLSLGILMNTGTAIATFFAIIGHKPVEAFSLSLIILSDKPSKFMFYIFVVIYSLCTPVSICISALIGTITKKLVVGIIEAISAGTFIFIGCHEWSELHKNKQVINVKEKLWHLGFLTLGAIWMLLIAIIEKIIEG